MTKPTCEVVRDRLPGLENGEMSAEEARIVESHVAVCVACAEERAIIRLIRETAPVPPPGLEARIGRALRSAPAAALSGRPGTMPPFAVAAGVAFVLLTGSLLLRGGAMPGIEREDVPAAGVTLGWPHVSDPILRTAPVLNDLTVEELETLLAELDS